MRTASAILFAVLGLVVVAALFPSRGHAQEPLGIVSQATWFDPSIQSAGMGGASVAAFWMDEPNEWRNPAALGSVQGIRYTSGKTHLTPFLFGFDKIQSDRLLVGAFGIGVAFGGKPFESLGVLRLDYDSRTVTDPFGTSLTFWPYERARSFSVGISALDLLSSGLQGFGSDPIGFRDRISISVGHTWTDLYADMGIDPILYQPWNGEGETRDRGALVRIAPLDQIGRGLRDPRETSAFRIELGGGYSERNYEDRDPGDVVVVLNREEIYGASTRVTMAFPTRIARGWFWDFATPTVSLAGAWDQTEGESPIFGGTTYRATRFGGELSILDMLFVRHGRIYRDPRVGDANTWGLGLAVQYRKAIGVRFDWARSPSWTEDSEDLDRYGITAFVEPFQFDTSGGLK